MTTESTAEQPGGEGVLADLDSQVTTSFYWYLAVLSCIGGFLFGCDTAVIGSVLDFVPYELSNFVTGYLVAGASLGAAVGALAAGPLTDRFGRKSLLIVDAAVYAIGALLSAIIALLLRTRMPESPRWLMLNKRYRTPSRLSVSWGWTSPRRRYKTPRNGSRRPSASWNARRCGPRESNAPWPWSASSSSSSRSPASTSPSTTGRSCSGSTCRKASRRSTPPSRESWPPRSWER
jgi:hypothetical protein